MNTNSHIPQTGKRIRRIGVFSLALLLTCCIFCGCSETDDRSDSTSNRKTDEILSEKDENTYETPVEIQQQQMNNKKYTPQPERSLQQLNGLCAKEYEQIYKILQKAGDYEDTLENSEEEFNDYIEELKNEYGSNYKYTLTVLYKDKLDKDDLTDVRDSLREAGMYMKEAAEDVEDWEAHDWEAFADSTDLSEKDARKLIAAYENFGEKLSKVDVTEGYVLEVEYKITGKKLDEPVVYDDSMFVFKIDGRWISESSIDTMISGLDSL